MITKYYSEQRMDVIGVSKKRNISLKLVHKKTLIGDIHEK